jgi:lipopolysaccharide heptosyltransferase II
LIVLLGAIGDVVRALPLAQRLHAGWPTTRLAWAVEPAAAPILEGHPALDQVILFERGQGTRAFVRFLNEVRQFRPDLTLDLQRHLKSGLTSWWSAAPIRIGFHWANSREGNWFFNNHHIPKVEHFSSKLQQYLRFADLLGVPDAPIEFGLRLRPEEEEDVRALLAPAGDRFAALCLGSTWESRRWIPAAAARLCSGLRKRGLSVVLLGGSAEVGFAQEVQEVGAGDVVDYTGRTSLRQLISILKQAVVAIGPDSGPMHIAAGVGTPVVSLWGPTSPLRSAPHAFEHLVVRGDVPCAPCYLSQCPIGRLCMERITPEAVLERVDAALSSPPRGS